MEAHANRAARWPLAAIVFFIFILPLSACDSGPADPDLEPNVVVLTGADVTTTDDAVLVAGVASIPLGNRPRGMYVQHHTEYTYGGLHQPINDDLLPVPGFW
jgi:hypothetical protein